jgi:hypothetical protein
MPRLTTRLALLVSLGLTAPAYAEGVILPPGFDGDYVPDGAPCTPENAISVKDGVMIGPEFSITVTDLIEHPTDPRQVVATLFNEAGGGEWTDGATLRLSAGGQELSFAYPDGSETIWLRCPRTY